MAIYYEIFWEYEIPIDQPITASGLGSVNKKKQHIILKILPFS